MPTLEELLAEKARRQQGGAAPQSRLQQLEAEKARRQGGFLNTAADVARSVPAGLRVGLESIAGLGGDLYNLQVAGAKKLADVTGMPPFVRAGIERETRGKNVLPSSQDISEQVTSPVVGENYQPKTRGGRVAHTLGTFLANPGRSLARNVIGPTIGTEAGAEIGEALGSETTGRIVGGLAGATAPGVTVRGIAGPRLSPERARLVETMEAEGVPLTGGQATGRKLLQYTETGPFEGTAASIADRQGGVFTRAALRRAGVHSDVASPEVMTNARDALGAEYESLIARNNGVPLDPTLEHELLDNVLSYQRLKGQAAAPAVNEYLGRISEAAQTNGGVVPADVFKTIRSDISRDLRSTTDPELIQSLRRMQDSLFEGIARNGQPEIVEQARDLNNRYRNFKIIEKAMSGAGEATAEGNVTPRKLRAAVEQGDRGALTFGRGDYGDLARAGEATMTPLPQSGTAGRLAPFAAAASAIPLMQGDWKTAATVAAGSGLPWAASKVLTSEAGRRAITNQAMGRSGPVLDPITAALIARQAELEGQR